MFSGSREPYTGCLGAITMLRQAFHTIKILSYVHMFIRTQSRNKEKIHCVERKDKKKNSIKLILIHHSRNDLLRFTHQATIFPQLQNQQRLCNRWPCVILTNACFCWRISYAANEIYCLTVKTNGDAAAGQDRIFKTMKNLLAGGDTGLTAAGRGININNLSSSPRWSALAQIPFNK